MKVMFPGVVGVRPKPATPVRTGGVQAQYVRGGALTLDGERVDGKRVGIRNGERVVTVTVGGRERTYRADALVEAVPGRRDLPAGPLGSKGGVDRPARVGRGDGESAGDRHSRLIDSITYDTAQAWRGAGRRAR